MIQISLTIYLKLSTDTRDLNYLNKYLLTCHKFNIDHQKRHFFRIIYLQVSKCNNGK